VIEAIDPPARLESGRLDMREELAMDPDREETEPAVG
jgi:hypothetical protein